MALDTKLALKNFYERRESNAGKQIDNSSLPAGAPMYYYCRFCGERTEILPESHTRIPKTICNPCKVLEDHGIFTPQVLTAKGSEPEPDKPFEHPLLRSLREDD